MKKKIILRKRSKAYYYNYDNGMKVKDISNDRLVDSKTFNEFNWKSQIKKKSSHITFSSSNKKNNSNITSKSSKEIDVFDQINLEELYTYSGSSYS